METDSIGVPVGLDGFPMVGAVEVEGEVWQLVETIQAVVGCSRVELEPSLTTDAPCA